MSRSSQKHPECLDLAFDGYLYWGIPSFTCDLSGPEIPLVTSGHEVATHLPSVLIGLNRRTESLLQVTSARAVLPQWWAWFQGARGVCAGLRTQLCTTSLQLGLSITNCLSAGAQVSPNTVPGCQGICIVKPQPHVSLHLGASMYSVPQAPVGLACPPPSVPPLPFPGLPGGVR